MAGRACPACGQAECWLWKRSGYVLASHGTMRDLVRFQEGMEVDEGEKKTRLRDFLNPLYYLRRELTKMTDGIIERIEKAEESINAGIARLQETVAAETRQFVTYAAELQGLATNPNLTPEQTARLSAIADGMASSAENIGKATAAVKGIVPDAPQTGGGEGGGDQDPGDGR